MGGITAALAGGSCALDPLAPPHSYVEALEDRLSQLEAQVLLLSDPGVDSGAVDSVVPPGVFEGVVKPSVMSKGGKKYRGPDSSRIPNLGQMDVSFESDEGHKCGMTWQVAEIERPLIAVSHLSAAGNKVVLEKDGGEIIHEKRAGKSKSSGSGAST